MKAVDFPVVQEVRRAVREKFRHYYEVMGITPPAPNQPQRREPLSRGEKLNIAARYFNFNNEDAKAFCEYAADIERAHGIGD